MAGISLSSGITAGWGAAGDRHVILKPIGYVPNSKPGIIWCAPYQSGATNIFVSPGAFWLAKWGYPVVCCDLGQARVGGVEGAESEWNGGDGPEQWTHDTAMAALDTIWTTIFPAIGALSGPGLGKCLITGGSAGGAKAVQWSRLHPDRVAKCYTVIGTVDLLAVQQDRPECIPGVGASITAKLGDPVPDAKNPAKAYLDWTVVHPPLRMAYAAADTICLPSETIALAADINGAGGQAEAIERSTGDHGSYFDVLDQEDAHWLIAS